MKEIGLFLMFVVIMFDSCSDKKNFVIGSMKTIYFEKEYKVAGEHLDVDSIGVAGVRVLDQYLIVETYRQKCYAKIYDLRSLDFLGDILCKGQGPGDVRSARVGQVKSPYLWVEDGGLNSIKIVNIHETMNDANRTLSIKNTIKYWNAGFADPETALYVNDTLLWVKSFDRDNETVSYFKYNPVKQEISDEISLFNYPVTSDIRNERLFIALLDCIKPDGSKIVSSNGILDQLDIYNLVEPDKSISVTLNDYLFDYEYVKYSDNMTLFYVTVDCSDNLIYALHWNSAENTYDLHIIDWNGNPLCKLIFDRIIRNVTIDFDTGFMYGVSGRGEDRIYRYDIGNILKEIY
jgi:hypothetical protein